MKRFIGRPLPKWYDEDPKNTTFKPLFLTDEMYAMSTQTLPLTNTDVIIVNNYDDGRVYLARRRVIPVKCLWFFGGRTKTGEKFRDAMYRCFKRELGLDVDKGRFQFVHQAIFTWKDRLQHPQDVGVQNNSYMFVIQLSEEELAVAAKKLDPNEYEQGSFRGYTRDELVASLDENPSFVAMLDLYDEIFANLV